MNTKLYYTEHGSGEPLILLHGNGEDSSYFVHQISYFSRNYRVIAVDTRGHGRSPRGTAPFTIRQFADDLCLLFDRLNLQNAHILGFSDGGNIALCFALKYPDRVKSLILNGANLYAQGLTPSVFVSTLLDYRLFLLNAAHSPAAAEMAELYSLMINDPNIAPHELACIRAPTLVLVGTEDMIRLEHSQLIADSIPNADLCVIEGSHFIAAECPNAFNAAVAGFLRSQ